MRILQLHLDFIEYEPVKKEIKVGLSDGINVEVLEGLKQKDSVVERPPKKIE